MATKHTPGPWRDAGAMSTGAYPTREDIVIESRGTHIGVVRREADARLVAAAPDLLAACQQLLEEAPDCGCAPATPEHPRDEICGACRVRAAILKATAGEAPAKSAKSAKSAKGCRDCGHAKERHAGIGRCLGLGGPRGKQGSTCRCQGFLSTPATGEGA